MKPPLVDPRDMQAVIRKMREMVPFYTPEWRFTPEDPDAGTALFLLFADMLMNNRERLNQVPERNFIAFLNMLGVGMAQARPAETFLTFELSTGVQKPVWIPVWTKVSGKTALGDEVFRSGPIIPARSRSISGACPKTLAAKVLPHPSTVSLVLLGMAVAFPRGNISSGDSFPTRANPSRGGDAKPRVRPQA